MQFKTWHAIDPAPTLAELKLKTAAEAGVPCILGPHDEIPEDLPDWSTAPPNRLIRAEVLRVILLRLEGCAPTDSGVLLDGAYISGTLDLADCTIPGMVVLRGCRFEQEIFAPRSNWTSNLRLENCTLPALKAAGATIGGQLGCMGTTFNTPEGISLDLQGTEIKQDLFLRAATFNGTADLNGAKIGGQLSCVGTNFNTPKGMSLGLQGAEIAGGLYLRHGARIAGLLDLTDAHTTTLVDDSRCWPPAGSLILDGFTYDRITRPHDIKTRLDWLARGDRWKGTFYPQPYKQLAKVLHDTGHEAEAQSVRITLACKLRQEARAQLHITPNGDLSVGLRSIWRDLYRLWLTMVHSLSRLLTAHGYQPQRSLVALIALLLLATLPSYLAWEEGSFAPNSSIVLTSPDWQVYDARLIGPPLSPNPAAHWSRETIAGRDWESFHPLAYAADVVIPIVDLGQTAAWAPSTERGPWGRHLWYLRWLFIALGWIVTALGAAALTGIIRRE